MCGTMSGKQFLMTFLQPELNLLQVRIKVLSDISTALTEPTADPKTFLCDISISETDCTAAQQFLMTCKLTILQVNSSW
jgi:hypothetical protein